MGNFGIAAFNIGDKNFIPRWDTAHIRKELEEWADTNYNDHEHGIDFEKLSDLEKAYIVYRHMKPDRDREARRQKLDKDYCNKQLQERDAKIASLKSKLAEAEEITKLSKRLLELTVNKEK